MPRQWATALAFLLMLSATPVFADFYSLPQNGQTSIRHEISLSPQGIRIQVKDRLLHDVLQRIQNTTGIRFDLHPNVLNVKVTANVFASDWKSAVRELLADFSKIGLWGDSLRSSKVRILQSGNPAPAAEVRVTQAPVARAKVQSKPVPVSYPEVIRGPVTEPPSIEVTLDMLSPHALMEPGLLNYLESAGVEVPEEMKLMYGSTTGSADIPPSPHVFYAYPMLSLFLESRGIEPPENLLSQR